jgi:hypothetical protein
MGVVGRRVLTSAGLLPPCVAITKTFQKDLFQTYTVLTRAKFGWRESILSGSQVRAFVLAMYGFCPEYAGLRRGFRAS